MTTRARQVEKRGGDELRVSLAVVDRIGQEPEVELLALYDALNRLAEYGCDASFDWQIDLPVNRGLLAGCATSTGKFLLAATARNIMKDEQGTAR